MTDRSTDSRQATGHRQAATQTLAEWLEDELERRGLTQAKLAVYADVAQATVNNIMRKGHIPRIETLFRVADYLGVDRVEMMVLAGLLRPADQLLREGHRPPPQPPADDPLVMQLLEEFRRVPDEWKPELIQVARLFQRLARQRRPTPASPDPES
jgi:transcriptional regulator with XRE-family HTH domain